MTRDRRERRRLAIAARKAETRARLSVPASPPTVPVALPWRRRPTSAALRRQQQAETATWSMMMSGDTTDLEGSLATLAEFVRRLGPALER